MGDRKPGAPTVWDERGAQRVGHRGNWAWVEGPSLGRERRFQATPEQARGAWGSELPRDVWDMEMMEGRQVFRAAGGGGRHGWSHAVQVDGMVLHEDLIASGIGVQ